MIVQKIIDKEGIINKSMAEECNSIYLQKTVHC